MSCRSCNDPDCKLVAWFPALGVWSETLLESESDAAEQLRELCRDCGVPYGEHAIDGQRRMVCRKPSTRRDTKPTSLPQRLDAAARSLKEP